MTTVIKSVLTLGFYLFLLPWINKLNLNVPVNNNL